MKAKQTLTTITTHVVLAAVFFSLAGCASIGPSKITHDRFDYSSAIAESWKAQTLLNIVKLRYLDQPVFLDVAQIVSGYTLQTSVSAAGMLSSKSAVQGNSLSLGGQAVYTDRPTITYSPLTGDAFLRSLLSPIPPGAIFRLVQTGYDAEFLFRLTMNSFNGLRNRSTRSGGAKGADRGFRRVAKLMSEIQNSGAVGLRVKQSEDSAPATVLFFRDTMISDEALEKIREAKKLLRINSDISHFRLVASPVRAGDDELAVSSRSLLQIMVALATYVDVPPEDIIDGRTMSVPDPGDDPLLHIRYSESKPKDSYAAVPYRNRWFWIDDKDLASKGTFTAVMFLFTLTGRNSQESVPIITIPAG